MTLGKRKEVSWGSKKGWVSGDYLKTRTYARDMSVRYMTVYTGIYETSSKNHRNGDVNFRTQVSLLDAKGAYSHIKTARFHGWVPSKIVSKTRPAIQ